ncbi:MAG TPA: endonuclease domain-containing protein [Devosiaceae bacterium]|jgi:very-short-patch-repair endonuclease|nr:endonuclease domain-containing protein [Devosiaceae bacterium]
MPTLKTQFAADTARKLRASMTDAERRLWYHLRDRRLLGHKFVRQQPVGPYIADFACREANLIVELDGGQHAISSAQDARRTAVLGEHGYCVLRFWSNDVLENTAGVLHTISEHLNKAPSPGLRFAPADLSPEARGTRGITAATEKTRSARQV